MAFAKRSIYLIFAAGILRAMTFTSDHMEKNCGQTIPNPDKHGEVAFYFSPANLNCVITIGGGRMGKSQVQGFFLVFEEVNLSGTDCKTANITMEGYMSHPDWYHDDIENSYQYMGPVMDHSIPGIPTPLCRNNIPWGSFPSPVIKSSNPYLKITFNGTTSTPRAIGFKLRFTNYYHFLCGPNEYKCSGHLCIPREASNSQCDSTDWCGDGSGCDNKTAVIVGAVCAAVGCTLIGFIIGCCIRWRVNKKLNQAAMNTRYTQGLEDTGSFHQAGSLNNPKVTMNTLRRLESRFDTDRFILDTSYRSLNSRGMSVSQYDTGSHNRFSRLNSPTRTGPSTNNSELDYANLDISDREWHGRHSRTSRDDNQARVSAVSYPPPPPYEHVTAGSNVYKELEPSPQKEPEPAPPSYTEVAENPAVFFPHGTQVKCM